MARDPTHGRRSWLEGIASHGNRWRQPGERRQQEKGTSSVREHGSQGSPRGSPRFGGHTGNVAESGWRAEPAPSAYRGEHGIGQAPCYGVMPIVSRPSIHRPVCSVPASRCRVEADIQPERVGPALRSRPPVSLHGPVCLVTRPRRRPPVCLPSLLPESPACPGPPARVPSPGPASRGPTPEAPPQIDDHPDTPL